MVAVLHLRNSDRLGGPERLILGHAERAAAGVSPTIASFSRGGDAHPLLDEARRRGIDVEAVEQRGSYDPSVVGRLRDAIDRRAPGVLVGHDYRANLSLLAAGRRSSIPRVAVVHGYTAEDRKVALFEALDRRVLRRAHAVVAVSAATRDQIVASGVPEARVHLAENGVDADAVRREAAAARAEVRREWGVADDERVVLALGRLSPEKGHAVLVEAFARVREPRARLVLAGDGVARGALEASASGDARVRFAGWRSDPWRCLGAADLFVLPSLREGLPVALLEAMAAGVPVVATRVGGVPHALRAGECGVLVPPGDPTALAGAIERLLRDAGEADALATRASADVRARHGIEAQARRLESVYRALAG